MSFIEPTPKNIISARLVENGLLTKKPRPSFIRSLVRRHSAPILPENETIENLFDTTSTWWTYVNQEPYIPLVLLASVLEPKEDKWSDDDGYHFGVFWANYLDKVERISKITPKSMTKKQRFSFVEERFSRYVIGGIVAANESQYRNVSKIGYQLRTDVQKDELEVTYTGFLASLAVAYSRRKKQDWLKCFIG